MSEVKGWTRDQMADLAAAMIEPGWVINLGIGIPTLVANRLNDPSVMIHSENGLLGMGPFPKDADVDPQMINAGKQTVTAVEGASTFSSALSFGMIRGGHIDAAFLGAMQVDAEGSIANWKIPGKKVTGMGGAMDLVSGAKRVVALMTHCSKKGEAKLLSKVTLPVTGLSCVSTVITNWGVFQVKDNSFECMQIAPGISKEEIEENTEANVYFV